MQCDFKNKLINVTWKVREELCFPYQSELSRTASFQPVNVLLYVQPSFSMFLKRRIRLQKFQGNNRKRPTHVPAQVSLTVRLGLLACQHKSIQSSQLHSVVYTVRFRISLFNFSKPKYFLVVYLATTISVIPHRNSFANSENTQQLQEHSILVVILE